MQQLILTFIILLASAIPAHAEDRTGGSTTVAGQVTSADSGRSITGVFVSVRSDSYSNEAITDAEGRYELPLRPGKYSITFIFRRSQLTRAFEARAGKLVRVNGRLRAEPGEVILIRDAKKARKTTAKNFDSVKAPPYSDKAITTDRWAKAWMLLDVDRAGTVTRTKFINRPGYDLEEIAVAEVFKLKFNPSLDEDGRPINTLVIWSIEWPSYWWLVDFLGVASRMPPSVNPSNATSKTPYVPKQSFHTDPKQRAHPDSLLRQQSGESGLVNTKASVTIDKAVPCRGSGPLELDSLHPVYRDCSQPNLDKDFDSEPWIGPPGSRPKKR